MKSLVFALFACSCVVDSFAADQTPPLRRPVPSPVQRERLADGKEIIGLVHWGINTFTDKEWGSGGESPELLNPSDFDADQIVQACKAGGISVLTVVAKHHDGFCLWPTKTTEHNITKSPFRGGKGDYIREMSDACRRAGLKFGVYCSPWDRNNAAYGTDAYLETYYNQWRELTGGTYGDIYVIWFDGAMGGSGWYGGANETRKIPEGYYRFERLITEVRARCPGVSVFEGQGLGDFRDPGNESGLVPADTRATAPLVWEPEYKKFRKSGCPNGKSFRPHQALFPLRPGWFFHERHRGQVRHGEYLMKLYLDTVGNACTMEIGIAPDRRGRLDDEDVMALRNFSVIRKAFFANEVKDEDRPFNIVVMKEDISKGEQVDGWEFHADGVKLLSGVSIGSKRIRVLNSPITAKHCEVVVTKKGPDFQAVSFRRFYVAPELAERVVKATSATGETDTARWMKAGRQGVETN